MTEHAIESARQRLQEAEALLPVDIEAAANRAEEALRLARGLPGTEALTLHAQVLLVEVEAMDGRGIRAADHGLRLVHEARALHLPAVEARIWEVVGTSCAGLDLTERAVLCFRRGLRLALDADDASRAARAETNLGVARSNMGRDAEALQLYDAALARLDRGADPAARARLLVLQATSLRRLGQLETARASLAAATKVADASGLLRSLPPISIEEGLLAAAHEQWDQALERLGHAASLAAANDQPESLAEACLHMAQVLRQAAPPHRDLDQASRVAEQGMVAARALDADEWRTRLHYEQSLVHEAAGRGPRALYHLRRALELEQGRARRRRERELAVLAIEHEVELLQQAQAALVQERRDLAEANRELEYLSREKSEFMAIANHDLRSPLALVRMLGDELQHGYGLEERRPEELGQLLVDACDRMLAIIDKLLVSQQLERKPRAGKRTPVDARLVAERILASQQHAAQAKGLHLALAGDPQLQLLADADDLAQVLDNLVSNALKFSPAGRPVTVELQAPDRIAVLDRGPGLTPEDLDRAFQKFARLSARPTGDESSTGLGLYIVRRLVEGMGGSVEAAVREGGGACFTVRLPPASPA